MKSRNWMKLFLAGSVLFFSIFFSLKGVKGDLTQPQKPTFVKKFAVFGSDSVTISGNTKVYSIDSLSNQAEQSDGDIRSNGQITISGSNYINGDVTCGLGLTAKISGNNQILGSISSADSNLDPQISLASDWLSYAQQNNNNSLIPSQFLDSSGNLKVTGNNTCTLPSGTYYLNAISLSGSGQLILTGDVIFTTYGKIDLTGSSRLNFGETPSKCLIVSIATKHNFSGNSKGNFELFSPLAEISTTGNFEGVSNLWGKAVTISGSVIIKRYVNTNPPAIQIVTPLNGSSINVNLPYIKITYSDNGGGVDLGTLEVKVDDTLIDYFTVTESQADGNLRTPLTDGIHTISARVGSFYGYYEEAQSSFSVDTIPPTITITSPQNNFLTNISSQTISGSVSEECSLSINGEAVSLDGLSFSKSVPLNEGTNEFVLSALDLAGNSSQLTLTMILDTIPPQIIDTSKVTISPSSSGVVTITGTPLSAEPNTLLIVQNTRTGIVVTQNVFSDGSFSITISGETNDVISLKLRDLVGNESPSISLTVPSSGGGGDEIPPDPGDVATPIDPTVPTDISASTKFLYEGENPIQRDVAPGTIEPRRVAILRGKVLNLNEEPVSGVKITILNHPEFGYTLTREDGMFDLAVNGGGQLTISYFKEGYLPIQRNLDTPWRDFIWAEDAFMTQLEPIVTNVNLSEPLPMQVAQGSVISDIDGERKGSILFPTGTSAQMVLENGTTQPLTSANIRITEYTVGEKGPKAMPAILPPQSGYTYCVELSADEAMANNATSVQFSQPLIYYVNNFIGFPIGSPVPVGSYDRTKGLWIPEENGIVIKILGYDSGLAILDVDGTGVPSDPAKLSALGITDEERANIASLYPVAGTSLWRVKISHFSPWDCNWPYGPPDDATDIDGGEPEEGEESENDCNDSGSIIGIQSQALGEAFGLTGMPFSLHYTSKRMKDYSTSYTLDVPVSKTNVPASVKRMEVKIEIAGKIYRYSYPPQTNLSQIFKWDGKDGYGREVQGSANANIKVSWVYPAVYKTPAENNRAFAQFSSTGTTISGNRNALEATLSKNYIRQFYHTKVEGTSIGGWNIDLLNSYDPTAKQFYYGNKESSSNQLTIKTVAGTGQIGYSGDGFPATQAMLNYATGIDIDLEGNIYFVDHFNYRIRKISTDGIITTVAGNGRPNYAGDGGPAIQASIYSTDLACGPDGSIYIADYYNNRIRKIDPSGIITTIGGNGQGDFGLDDVPATETTVPCPLGISLGPDNSIYVSDSRYSRIRKIDTQGIITTIAGNNTCGFSGDGGPAKQATFCLPWAIEVSAKGNIYIKDLYNYRVRKIDPSGIITSIAGNGQQGFSGDGGPAYEASLGGSTGSIGIDSNENVFIADERRIRRIDQNGIITTIAGNGTGGPVVENAPPTQSPLAAYGVVISPSQSIYIGLREKIISLVPALPGFSVTDVAIPSPDGSEIYHFSSQGRHLQTLNSLTGSPIWTFGYDSEGRLVSITDAYNNTATIERDGGGNPTAIVSPYGQRTTLTTNAQGYLSSMTNPKGETLSFTYSEGGLLKTFTDAKGQVHTFNYDENGRLISDENPSGGIISLSMQEVEKGWSVTTTTSEGITKTYTISDIATGGERRTVLDSGCTTCSTTSEILPNGTTTVTSGDGTISTITEGPDPRFGMMASIPKSFSVKTPSGKTLSGTMTRTATLSDPSNILSLQTQTDTLTINSKTFTTTYTASNKTFVTKTPTSRQVSSQIDNNGKVVSQSISGIDAINFSYDSKGRLQNLSQGSRNVSLSYDLQGNLSCVTDPIGRSVNFSYDQNNRVTSQTFPDGRSASFNYDANGNITSVTPPGKPAHTFTYTPIDLQATYTPPDIGTGDTSTHYSYNLDKQLIRVDRPDGKSIEMNYDGSGRLSSVATPDGTTNLSYSDSTGQLTSIQNPDGITNSYTYDGFLPIKETWTSSTLSNKYVQRNFNGDFQLYQLLVSGGTTATSYTYDNDGLLIKAGNLTLTRNTQNGLLTTAKLGNVTDTYTYNTYGEVTNYTSAYPAGLSHQVSFTRDAIGRITGKTEVTNGITTTWEYSYDLAGRLIKTNLNGGLYAEYGYDTNGNRLTKTTPTQTITATYDAQDRLLTYGNYTYTYSANGELETKTNTANGEITTYQYDLLGNLKKVVLPDGKVIEYIVDGRNRRVGKKVNGVIERQWIYDGQLRPVAEYGPTGTITATYIYATHINIPDYIVKSGTMYKVITDHLGSLRFVINSSNGTIAQRIDYDDWGNVLVNTAPDFTPFGFAGGIYDKDTKLTRFGARDYDAEVGRWTSKDPIGFGGKVLNLYSYCNNVSTTITDPQGEVWPALLPAVAATAFLAIIAWDLIEPFFKEQQEKRKIEECVPCHLRMRTENMECQIREQYHLQTPDQSPFPLELMPGHTDPSRYHIEPSLPELVNPKTMQAPKW